MSTNEQVIGLKELLKVQMIEKGVEIEKTNQLIEIVGKESLEAEREGAIAAE